MADIADKPASPATPPWGADEDFDPAKAWDLIQTLRASEKALKTERSTYKTERDALATKVDEFENAGKTAEERQAEAERTASQELSAARRELWVERALRKHGVPEDLVEFLIGDDEDAILAKAEKLAGLGKTPAPADGATPADGDAPADTDGDSAPPAPTSRPKPGLTPGHGGEGGDVLDLDDLVMSTR